jgi:hypothetical protein
MDPRLRGDDKKEDNSTFYDSIKIAKTSQRQIALI